MIDPKEKKISPTLAAAADIRMKYFGETPTTLTLKEIKAEVVAEYENLPAIEVAMIFMLIDGWYAQLHKDLPLLEVA
jgi:hypothetical protein